jgi:hypothetical protein
VTPAPAQQDPGHWHIQCQWHPPAWVAVRRPTATGVHIVVAHDLDDLEAKLAAADGNGCTQQRR